ncbi:MAG TPA: hypothetical protein VEK33_13875 [Terriglobales bacterium]|nr:hypothetical protein [Terriglobales bacterium]
MARLARISAVLFLTVVGASLAVAQTTSRSEQSGSALGKLNYFAGTWRLEVHMKMSPLGSRAFFGTEHNEWERGGSLLVSRQEGLPAEGSGGLAVMAYNPQEKAYTYHVVKDTGEAEDLRGMLEDHTWTWMSDSASGNQVPRTRFIVQEISPTSYSLKFETSSEGRDWSTVMEGKAVKVLKNAHQDVAFLR